MATIQIRKKSANVWVHIPSDANEFRVSKFYVKDDNIEFQVVEQGGSGRKKYPLAGITVYDDTASGTPEPFVTFTALMLRLETLRYPGFNYPEVAGQIFTENSASVTFSGSGSEVDPLTATATAGGTATKFYTAKQTYTGAAITIPLGFDGTIDNMDAPQSTVTFSIAGTDLTITGGVNTDEYLHIYGLQPNI